MNYYIHMMLTIYFVAHSGHLYNDSTYWIYRWFQVMLRSENSYPCHFRLFPLMAVTINNLCEMSNQERFTLRILLICAELLC